MVENYLPWAFRLIAVGLVCWTVFLVLRKVLRRAGIVAYKPFVSRSEYLEAALEMNLEDFIGRAKATPKSITRKLPAPTFKMADQESIFQTIDSMIQTFSRGLEEAVALKKVEAVTPSNPIGSQISIKIEGMGGALGAPGAISGAISGAIGAQSAIGGPGTVGVSSIPPARWFRVKETGELVGTGSCKSEACRLHQNSRGGLDSHLPSELEPAIPRRGEWWQKRECPNIHGKPCPQVSWRYDPIQWSYSADVTCEGHGAEICAALCGCLEPVNFGKGNEKSGVA